MAYGRKRSYKSKRPAARRRSTKRRKFSRKTYTKTLPVKVMRNTRKIARVAKIVDSTTATHTKRYQFTAVIGSDFGKQNIGMFTANNTGLTKGVLNKLQFFDPSIPETLLTTDGNFGEYQRDFQFAGAHTSFTLKNQGFCTKHVKVYKCFPKSDTNIKPLEAWIAGLENQLLDYDDQAISNKNERNPHSYPNDSAVFKALWRTEDYVSIRMAPGAIKTWTHTGKPYVYSPALEQSIQEGVEVDFRPAWQAMVWMVVVVGEIVVGTQDAQVTAENNTEDLLTEHVETFKVTYDAGASLDTVEYQTEFIGAIGEAGFAQERPTSHKISTSGAISPTP